MAKAILGHTRGPDPRVLYEVHRLRQRVRDLEAELIRLRADNDALAAETPQDMTGVVAPTGFEPALPP
jgi:uncharacterized small protein (DUF1192 family)